MARLLSNVVGFFSLRGMTWREVPPMIVLALTFLWVVEWSRQYYRDNAPAEQYYELRQFAVPDHPVGVDPSIVFDRTIHRDHDAEWTVTIQDLAQNLKDVCYNSRRQHYFKGKLLPVEGVTLRWLLQDNCPETLPSGSYRTVLCRVMERERARDLRTCYATQPFNIFDVKELLQQGEQQ